MYRDALAQQPAGDNRLPRLASQPNLSAFALLNIAWLLQAETVDDVLKLPFPMPLAPLIQPEKFSAFYLDAGPNVFKFAVGDMGEISIRNSRVVSMHGSYDVYVDFKPTQLVALSEATQIIRTADNSRASSDQFQYYAYMSGRVPHGNYWHLELRETNPNAVVLSTSSHNGTEIVPNISFREVLKNSPYADLLYMPVRAVETMKALMIFDEGLRSKTHPMHAQFKEASVFVADNVVNAISGITPHRQGLDLHPLRIFEKACAPKAGCFHSIVL